MRPYAYKTLIYALEGKFTHSLRYWRDHSGQKVYGGKQRARLVGGIPTQMQQLEQALWELVAYSTHLAFPMTCHGTAVLRRPPRRISPDAQS